MTRTDMEPVVIRVPLTITVYPHFMDHCFADQVVFPAVESLKILAASTMEHHPVMAGTDPWTMVDAKFNKFLFIKPGTNTIEAYNDIRVIDDTHIIASLITRTPLKNKAMTRIKEHIVVGFSRCPESVPSPPFKDVEELDGQIFQVSRARLYQELVPFGHTFHSITGNLQLSSLGAVARLKPGFDDPDDPLKNLLGSGFPLDGAFHAGCVWSQRFQGIVAFPMGFKKRIIVKKTKENQEYVARIIPRHQRAGTLEFDIWIMEPQGSLCEIILGVIMQDVSGGTMTPPEWIREASP